MHSEYARLHADSILPNPIAQRRAWALGIFSWVRWICTSFFSIPKFTSLSHSRIFAIVSFVVYSRFILGILFGDIRALFARAIVSLTDLPYSNHCRLPIDLWCMNQNRVYNVDGSIVGPVYFGHYLICRRRQHHRFPCWQWIPLNRTTATPVRTKKHWVVSAAIFIDWSEWPGGLYSPHRGRSRRAAVCARKIAPDADRWSLLRWNRAVCPAWLCCVAWHRDVNESVFHPGPVPMFSAAPCPADAATPAWVGTSHIWLADIVRTAKTKQKRKSNKAIIFYIIFYWSMYK